jgi:preprotein translocase subunit SecG
VVALGKKSIIIIIIILLVIIIIIFIFNIINHPHRSLHSSSVSSQNSTGLTHQALFINFAVKMFLTVRHVLSIAAFCVRIYREKGGDKQFQAAV